VATGPQSDPQAAGPRSSYSALLIPFPSYRERFSSAPTSAWSLRVQVHLAPAGGDRGLAWPERLGPLGPFTNRFEWDKTMTERTGFPQRGLPPIQDIHSV
jgi:hypothetical protein